MIRFAAARFALLAGCAALLALASSPATGMPPHPQLLQTQLGRGALAEKDAELRKQGLDQPVRTARAAGGASGMHVLVLLADFPDWTWNRDLPSQEYIPDHYRTLLFSVGTVQSGSMRDYYRENSFGAFDVTGDVSGWHRLPQNYSSYVAGRRGIGGAYPNNARKMVEDAVRAADQQNPSLDFSRYDNDGPDGVPSSGDDDGTVDGIIVVHAGPGYEESGNPNDIHSHFWTVVESNLEVDGVRVFQYMTTPQDGRIGVFAHEFGHNLGLPDLYETDGGGSSVVGVWSIMSVGAWLAGNGTVFGPLAGTRPSHFDAWSKSELGFVTPVTLTDNAVSRALRPIENFPDMARLWTNGDSLSHEYFLVENRAPRGFDQGLPFASGVIGGLLIWHVDEQVATNDDVTHPRIRLEQADGRADIEFGRNHGDTGDFYSLGARFGFETRPSSRSYAGAPTQVEVGNVRILTEAAFSADLEVEDAPALRKRTLTFDDAQGNQDGGLDASERAQVLLAIENDGLLATNVTVELASTDPRITVEGGPVAIGNVAPNTTVQVPAGAFTLAAGSLETDPYPYELLLRTTADGYAAEERLTLVAGDVIGLSIDFEAASGADGFTHSAGRPGYRDDWHLAPGYGRNSSRGYRCALPGGPTYADLTDARLDSPVFALDGSARLILWQTIDAEVDAGNRAWDGGFASLSLDGGPFTPITPAKGYPYVIIRNSESPIAEEEVFSGEIAAFERVEFDLTGMSGAGRLRFHFGSDGSETRGGWVIDDVTVVSPEQPYAVRFFVPQVTPLGVEITFTVEEFFPEDPYAGRGFNVWRRKVSPDFPLRPAGGEAPEGYVQLNSAPLMPGDSYIDSDVGAAELYAYLLEDLREANENSRFHGPRRVFVDGGAPAPRVVRSLPNPFRPAQDGVTTIHFVVPGLAGFKESVVPGNADPVEVEVGVYDVSGRLLRKLVDRPLFPGKNTVQWDGWSDRGFFVPSGVYYVRLEARGKSDARSLVLVR